MRKMIAKKATRDGRVTIELNNYTAHDAEISVYEISRDNAADAVPKADFVSDTDGQFTKVWKATIPPREVWRVSYTGKGGGILDIRGIEDAKKMVVDLDV
jgi:DNA topoisomerase-6 subunit B